MKHVLTALILCVAGFFAVSAVAQKTQPLPEFGSMTPAHVYVNTSTTVTITGKNFRSGMVLVINSLPQQTKVVNQYRATAVIAGAITRQPARWRFYLLTKQGQVGPGEQYLEICDKFAIAPVPLDPTPFTIRVYTAYKLQVVGGCRY